MLICQTINTIKSLNKNTFHFCQTSPMSVSICCASMQLPWTRFKWTASTTGVSFHRPIWMFVMNSINIVYFIDTVWYPAIWELKMIDTVANSFRILKAKYEMFDARTRPFALLTKIDMSGHRLVLQSTKYQRNSIALEGNTYYFDVINWHM